jgi:hypothetical protein
MFTTVSEGISARMGALSGVLSLTSGEETSYLLADGERLGAETSYSRDFTIMNTGTVGAYPRVYIALVWQDANGEQVALPGDLLTMAPPEDSVEGWIWVKTADGYWHRVIDSRRTETESGLVYTAEAIPPGESATATVGFSTGALPDYAEGLNVKVSIFAELVGERVYAQAAEANAADPAGDAAY